VANVIAAGKPAHKRRIRIPDGVAWNRVADEAVLLNLNSSTYYMLNESGTLMWEQLAEHGETGPVVEVLRGVFSDADLQTLASDLDRLIEELVSAGLLLRESR
jgi:hypothetical protein